MPTRRNPGADPFGSTDQLDQGPLYEPNNDFPGSGNTGGYGQVQAPSAGVAPGPGSNKVTSPNGWYVTGGTNTYDQNGLLQGILGQNGQGYNRAGLAAALYDLQMSPDKGNGLDLDQWLSQHQDIAQGVKSGKGGEYLITPEGGQYDVRQGYNPQNHTGNFISFGAGGDPGDRGGGNMSAPTGGYNWESGGGGGGGEGGSQMTGSSSSGNPFAADVMKALTGMFPNGAFNQDVVNRRVDNQRDVLNRNRISQGKSNAAQLASRGLIGSGPEQSASTNLESRLGDQFNSAVNDIYANEGQAADQRMMSALQTAAGLTSTQAQQMIDTFRANTERQGVGYQHELGLGNLALGNMQAQNSYNLGLGSQGLDRDRLLYDIEHGDTQSLIDLIAQLYQGAGTSAGGHQ